MTIYAIGDIHGHLDKLRLAHARIAADRAAHDADAALVVHTGDLVDRGPDSAGVVSWLMQAQAADARLIVLTGNHDQMFTRWLETGPTPDPRDPPHVRYLSEGAGGSATLASYDIDPTGPPDDVHAEATAKVPTAHRAWLAGLPVTHQAEGCIFVHAGLRPGIPLDRQDKADLVWIRDDFLTDTGDHGAFVVHGHTPVKSVEHHPNRLNIDTGAAWGGPVTAVVIDAAGVWQLTDKGRRAVPRLGPA